MASGNREPWSVGAEARSGLARVTQFLCVAVQHEVESKGVGEQICDGGENEKGLC